MVADFTRLSQGQLQLQLDIPPSLREEKLTISIAKALAVVWKRAVPLDAGRDVVLRSGVLELLLRLMAVAECSEQLAYTTSVLLSIVAQDDVSHLWFSQGNSIRGLLTALHQALQPSDGEAVSRGKSKEELLVTKYLLRVLVSISSSRDVIGTLKYLLPLQQATEMNLAFLAAASLQCGNEDVTKLALR